MGARHLCPLIVLVNLVVVQASETMASPLSALNRAEGARAQALGGSGIALGFDPTLVGLNPASAAHVTASSLTLSGQTGFLRGFTGQVLGAFPVLDGVLTLGGVLDDAGSVTLNASDGTSRQVTARRDIIGMLAFSGELSPQMDGGFLIKALRSELIEEFQTTGVIFDAGMQARVSDTVKAGVAIKNFGTNLKYLEDEITLPAQVRVGIAVLWRLREYSPFSVVEGDVIIAMVDSEHRVQEGLTSWRGGLEYQWRGVVALRAGGRLGAAKSLGNLSVGLGLRFKQDQDGRGRKYRQGRQQRQYRLDYSIRLLTSKFDPPQTLSVTIAF